LLNPDVIAKAAELDCSYHARQVKRDVLCTWNNLRGTPPLILFQISALE
jgi:hypothetical protein